MHSNTDKIIELIDVNMRWEHRNVLHDVCLSIHKGDFMAITGPNGGGKTTLLRIILRLIKPSSGQVRYFNSGHPAERLHIGYLPQKNMIDSRFPISVRQVIASGLLGSYSSGITDKKARIAEMIHTVDLCDHADSSIGNLSGGQLQRALLGRALISQPDVLVLDEPLSYIDKRFESRIYDIIADVAPHSTILLVSHEMTTIAAMANRHLIIDRHLHECTAAHHYIRTECDE